MSLATRPASPPAHPLFGHARAIQRDPLGFLTFAARTYGDLVPLRYGPYPLLLVSEPSAVEEVLVRQNRGFVKALSIRRLSAVVGQGLLTSEGQTWQRERRLIQPAFHREQVAAYGQVMIDATRRMLDQWRDGQTMDVHRQMMALTLEIVAACLFGADVHDQVASFGVAATEALKSTYARVNSLLIMLPDAVPTPQMRRIRRATARLDALVYDVIARRRAAPDEGHDLLTLMLQARDADDGTGMTDQQLRDEVMTLVLAGHETTAIALSWAWYLLALNPRVEDALHAEVDAVLGGRPPSVDDVPKLRYTRNLVNEVLRLYPPAWMIEREAIVPVEIGGRRWPKGISVLISPWIIHRDGRYFKQPEQFLPERWETTTAERLPRFAYLPFGGGPRMCIGNGFALQEAVLLLASIAQRFQIRLLPGQSVEPDPSITLRPRNGVQVQLRARSELGWASVPAGGVREPLAH